MNGTFTVEQIVTLMDGHSLLVESGGNALNIECLCGAPLKFKVGETPGQAFEAHIRDVLGAPQSSPAADTQREVSVAFSERQDALDALRLRVLMQWGVRHSMEHPISDRERPYYVCLRAPDDAKSTAHGATLAEVADVAIDWLQRHHIDLPGQPRPLSGTSPASTVVGLAERPTGTMSTQGDTRPVAGDSRT